MKFKHALVLGLGVLAEAAATARAAPAPDIVQVKEINNVFISYSLRIKLSNTDSEPHAHQEILQLADNSVVVGAFAETYSQSFKSQLLNVDQADRQYFEFQNEGDSRATGAMLVKDGSHGLVEISAHQIAANSSVWVELRINTTICHQGNAWFAALGDPDRPIKYNDARLQAVGPTHIAANDCDVSAGMVTGRFAQSVPVTAHFGRVDLGQGQGASMLRIDLATQLLPFDQGTPVVFVIDRSWSMTDNQLDQQFAAIAEYLQVSRIGRYQLVAFDRYAEALLPNFATAAQLLADLPRWRLGLAQRNGSNVDEGMTVAAKLLGQRAGRIVVFTDQRWRTSLSDDELRTYTDQAVPHTIVHAIEVIDGVTPSRLTLSRREDESLVALVAGSGGLSAALSAAPGDQSDLAGLVAPQALEQFSLDDEEPMDLARDTGGWWVWPTPRTAKITLHGRLWSRPWTITIAAQPQWRTATAAFAATQADVQDPATVAKLAHLGHALSSQTSYVLSPRRPVQITPTFSASSSNSSTSCRSCRLGTGRGVATGTATLASPLPLHLVQAGAQRCWRQFRSRLGAADENYQFALQLGNGEVVDVVKVSADNPSRSDCLSEAFWNLALPRNVATTTTHINITLNASGSKLTQSR